jgi:hypothetical protein
VLHPFVSAEELPRRALACGIADVENTRGSEEEEEKKATYLPTWRAAPRPRPFGCGGLLLGVAATYASALGGAGRASGPGGG